MLGHRLALVVLPGAFAVCRLAPDSPLPDWAAGPLLSVTRTADEVSVVCPEGAMPGGVRAERGWRCLRVVGTLDFALVGVLAALLVPLATAGVSVFALSTFETDYLMVRQGDLGKAAEALRAAGHAVDAGENP
jgi:hypothetical protein